MRRWLQLGAASAGMGAALIGWSLVGSEVGVANADSGAESSASAGQAASPSKRVDSGSAASSPSGRAKTAPSRHVAKADPPSTTSRKASRTEAADDRHPPSQVVSRSNRVPAAETSSISSTFNNITSDHPRETLPAAATVQPSATPGGSLMPQQSTGHQGVTPAAPTNDDLVETMQDFGPIGVTAGKTDGLGALGKVFADAVKKALDSKTLLNPVQRLDGKLPGLLDLIPKIPVSQNHSLWRRELQAKEEEREQRADARTREIDEILRKGAKFTNKDGATVYTTDGKTFVTYYRPLRDGPLAPTLVRLDRHRSALMSDENFDKNTDRIIRRELKLDPAFVRSLWGRPLPLRQ